MIILGSEIEDRLIDPWLSHMRSEFESTADRLRDLAARDIAQRESISAALEELGTMLDTIAHFHMHLGCGDEFTTLVQSAVECARRFKSEKVDAVPLAADSVVNRQGV